MADDLKLSKIALCKIQDVKAIISPSLGSADANNLITILINAFSKYCEGSGPWQLNRKLEKKEYTEYRDGSSHRCVFFVQAPPIDETTIQVWEDPLRVFDDATKLELWDDYSLITVNHNEYGGIKKINSTWQPYAHSIKATYSGGLVLHDEDNDIFICPDELRYKAALQVAAYFKQRDTLNVKALSVGGGVNTTIFQPSSLLPIVKETLLSYRNHH